MKNAVLHWLCISCQVSTGLFHLCQFIVMLFLRVVTGGILKLAICFQWIGYNVF